MVASANARLRLETVKLTALFGKHRAVRDVSLLFPAHTVTAIIGPSGCGKSTLLRCLNRMHELTPDASVVGEVLLDDVNVYAPGVNPVELRRRVGMVFQRPTPFPTMSVYDNVAAGLRVNGKSTRHDVDEAVARALQQAALWDEVKDRLRTSALALSGGQQQRLCIARAVAPRPEILLLDELCHALKRLYTIVIVTHNMQQAARLSDYTAFMYLGSLIEVSRTDEIFTKPKVEQTGRISRDGSVERDIGTWEGWNDGTKKHDRSICPSFHRSSRPRVPRLQ